MEKVPTIVHFDISADNIERAKKFYNKLFGWKIEKSLGFNGIQGVKACIQSQALILLSVFSFSVLENSLNKNALAKENNTPILQIIKII